MKKLLITLSILACAKIGYSQNSDDLKNLKPLTHEEFGQLGAKDLKRVNKRPYIVSYKHASGGELFYFGSSHIYDPKSKMLKTIDSAWLAFKPDIVLWEGGEPGRISNLPNNIDDAVKQKGEPGFVRFLAKERNVQDLTLEPSVLTIIKELQKKFSDEEILVHGILTQIEQAKRKGTPNAKLDSLVINYLKRSQAFNFKNIPTNLDEFQTAVTKILPRLENWKEITLDMVAPKSLNNPKINTLQKIATVSSEVRDRHMLTLLLTEVKKGRKVFAVVGASHIIIQEPALCQFFGVPYK